MYGVTIEPQTVHPVQCRCCGCGLVFANPQASEEELRRFCSDYYAHLFPQYLPAPDEVPDLLRAGRGHVRKLLAWGRVGKFLEVGFGSGRLLAAARDEGFDVYGVDLSPDAVEYARATFGLENVWLSTLEERGFADDTFDIVYAWHVIEHVRDLDGFIRELRRVLKPGGLLFLGTESAEHTAASLFRLARIVRGRVPRTVTATEHTYVFSKKTLRDALERRGFVVAHIVGYDEVRNRFRTPVEKRLRYAAVWLIAGLTDRLRRNGPYLKCFAYKTGSG